MTPFGFGGKIAEDPVWLSTVDAQLPFIASLAEKIGIATAGMGQDMLHGVSPEVQQILGELDALRRDSSQIEVSFKTVGKPDKNSVWRGVDEDLNQFIIWTGKAFGEGKTYWKAWGGSVGDRARNETGMAQRAAILRLMGPGKRFVEYSNNGMIAGLRFLDAVKDRK